MLLDPERYGVRTSTGMRRDPNCTKCKLHKTAQYVCLLGQGPRRSDVMIIGEAPGQREDDSGKPFVGRSGKKLDEILSEYNFDRDEVFITNAVSCRPPDNRKPTKTEIKACNHWLDYQIKFVKPKFILLLGNTPLQAITGKSGIKKARGKPFEKDGIVYLPTFHPSFALRDPRQEWAIRKDVRLFREIVDEGGIPREKQLNVRLVTRWSDVKEMLKDLHGTVSFDIETSCLYPWSKHRDYPDKNPYGIGDKNVDAEIQSIGFGTRKNQWIIPFQHRESPWKRRDQEEIVQLLGKVLPDCLLVTQNGKFDFLWMKVHFNVEWHHYHFFDTMIAHYMLDENDLHGLKEMAQKFLGAPNWDVDGDTKRGQGPLSKLALYQSHDLFYTRSLRFFLGKWFDKEGDVKVVFDKIMMPCSRKFVDIEYDGVEIDETKMAEAESYLRSERRKAKRSLDKWGRINWGSPQQVAELLFKRLKIPVVEVTKTGRPSTSESVLKRIEHDCVADLLKFREANQQLSFFIDGWKAYLVDGRLHPSFKLTGTVTGRLSCEHPNLQQVPRDKRIRQLIFAMFGWELVEADLSQIELRIATELAGERHMMEAFLNGVDVHWLTCLREIERGAGQKDLVLKTARVIAGRTVKYSEAIDVLLKAGPKRAEEVDERWKELRKKAKAINFGYLYGMWWKKFKIYARDNYGVNITDEQAEDSREFFFDTYSDYPAWHERQRRYARRNGYVRTLSGRKRRLPDAQAPDDNPFRREAERQAINSPVQSFANEINLMALIAITEEYGRDVIRVCGTVHDAILMRVRRDKVVEVTERLLQIMSRPPLFDDFEINLKVPVLAEAKVGPWGASVDFHKWKAKRDRQRELKFQRYDELKEAA